MTEQKFKITDRIAISEQEKNTHIYIYTYIYIKSYHSKFTTSWRSPLKLFTMLPFLKYVSLMEIGFNIKNTQCVGNSTKNFLLLWGKELAAAQFKLIELTVSESVQKLFNLETEFISKFSLYTVQEDWLLKTKNHLEKYEKKLRLKKLKKIRMLASTDDLYFECLERFESHYQFFRFKSRLFDFCESFIPDFENLHYFLHLNEAEDDVNEEKDLENNSSVETRDVNTSSLDKRLNIKDNAAKMLNNRLQDNFVSKNVVNFPEGILRVLKYPCCQKALILFQLLIQ